MNVRIDNVDLKELDKQYVLHPTTALAAHMDNGPTIAQSAINCNVKDTDGEDRLDAVGGLWCVNAGYGRQELADAMSKQAKELGYFHSFSSMSNSPMIRLSERLVNLVGGKMSKVFYGTSGSDANDSLIKIVWNYNYLRGKPQKQKIISRDYAYHGVSVATASLTGIGAFHRGFGLPLPFVVHASCPHYYRYGLDGESEGEFCDRMVQELRDLIEQEGADSIGAMIAEPIMGAGGVIVPPKGYFQKVQEVLKENDILLIADEVICGFGRLGTWFGHHFFDFEPDMIASAKGITSGYFPMSAAFISEDIWQVLLGGSEELGVFAHGYTYSGHPVGAATALANLDILERESLVENAAKVGAHMQSALRERLLKHPNVGEIRGEGLIAAVQLVESKDPKTFYEAPNKPAVPVAAAAMNHGVIIRPLPTGDSLAISPPLIITEKEVDFLVSAIEKSLADVY